MHIFLPQALILAATQTPPRRAGGSGGGPQDLSTLMIMIGVIVLLFWMIILKPQRRDQLKREQMMDGLAKGDKVMTTGGCWAPSRASTRPRDRHLTVAPKVVVDFSRAAIANVIQKKGNKPAGDKSDAEASKTARARFRHCDLPCFIHNG